ncbi:MAG: hypothetical protein JRD89_00390 [Deltaproteobacteria bacterium]|nr:hypothetical protein [Deltaproteobacteria bacterium]
MTWEQEKWLDLACAALGCCVMAQVIDGELSWVLLGPQGQVWAQGEWEQVEEELKQRAKDMEIVTVEMRFSEV